MNFFELITFPSKLEWTTIMDEFPSIRQIAIKTKLSLDESSITNLGDAMTKPNDFSNWQTRLVNKLGKLRFSYVLLIYYSKGLPDENWVIHDDTGETNFFPDFKNSDYYKKFMFDFYTESFYYHYFSTVDIIPYLLNIFYDLNVKEDFKFSKEVYSKIFDKELKKGIDIFHTNTRVARNGRNALTHRFPFNEIDIRSKKIGRTIYGGINEYTTSVVTIKQIQEIVNALEKLLRLIENKLKNRS